MKKLITLIIIIMSTAMSAQISVVENTDVQEIGSINTDISLKKINDNTYAFFYSNQLYQSIIDIKHIEITETGNDLESLYVILNNMILEKPSDIKELSLGDSGELYLSYSRASRGIRMIHYIDNRKQGETIAITQKGLDQLFGKPKRKSKDAKTPLSMPNK